jgi:hypothetical protein
MPDDGTLGCPFHPRGVLGVPAWGSSYRGKIISLVAARQVEKTSTFLDQSRFLEGVAKLGVHRTIFDSEPQLNHACWFSTLQKSFTRLNEPIVSTCFVGSQSFANIRLRQAELSGNSRRCHPGLEGGPHRVHLPPSQWYRSGPCRSLVSQPAGWQNLLQEWLARTLVDLRRNCFRGRG